jgi:hypothetical protein
MKLALPAGTTSKRLKIFVQDTSRTDGGGLTGLVYNTSGVAWWYHKDGDTTATQVTIVTATVGTWTSGGLKEIDATNLPGWYEIGVPNAALAAGTVHMQLRGAANMFCSPIEIQTDNIPANMQQVGGQTASAAGGVTFPDSLASTTNIIGASGVGLTAAYDPAKTAAQATTALSNADWTTVRAAKLDNLNATILSRAAPSDVAPTINFAPTISPTTLDPTERAAIAASTWASPTSGIVTAGSIGVALLALAARFTGITSLIQIIGVIAGKTSSPAALAEITATTGGASYDNTTKSLEAQAANGNGVTLDSVSSGGAAALRSALAVGTFGVYSSTIKTPRGWLASIVKGDDCLVANQHSLGNFTVPDPSLVGTTAVMAIRMNNQAVDYLTSTVAVTASNQVLRFEMTRSVSSLLQTGEGLFYVRFVDGTGNVSTWIVEGAVRVYPRLG